MRDSSPKIHVVISRLTRVALSLSFIRVSVCRATVKANGLLVLLNEYMCVILVTVSVV